MGLGPNIEEEMHGPRPGQARARAQRPGPHFLLNIRAQAHPNPSISSLPAPGGRASGRLNPKKEKKDA